MLSQQILNLTVSQISVSVASGAAWATRERRSESGHQSPSHRCNRVRNVAFRPQRRIFWTGNLRVRQIAGRAWWHDLLRGESFLARRSGGASAGGLASNFLGENPKWCGRDFARPDPETLRDGRGPMPRNRCVAGRRTWRRGDGPHESDGGCASVPVLQLSIPLPDLMWGCRQARKSPPRD